MTSTTLASGHKDPIQGPGSQQTGKDRPQSAQSLCVQPLLHLLLLLEARLHRRNLLRQSYLRRKVLRRRALHSRAVSLLHNTRCLGFGVHQTHTLLSPNHFQMSQSLTRINRSVCWRLALLCFISAGYCASPHRGHRASPHRGHRASPHLTSPACGAARGPAAGTAPCHRGRPAPAPGAFLPSLPAGTSTTLGMFQLHAALGVCHNTAALGERSSVRGRTAEPRSAYPRFLSLFFVITGTGGDTNPPRLQLPCPALPCPPRAADLGAMRRGEVR